jgi:hypothetical protein
VTHVANAALRMIEKPSHHAEGIRYFIHKNQLFFPLKMEVIVSQEGDKDVIH